MSIKHLHIISFDVPYPADYGGVIDVFYKIKALSKIGINIHLHCFEYGRKAAPELEVYCSEVKYYKRKTGFSKNLSFTPYIIKSRISKELISNLKKDNYPILCEGMHTCGILKYFKSRTIIYRSSNIEHEYYNALAKKETSFFKKLFLKIEALKLKYWEKNLAKASLFLTVSKREQSYYKKKFPKINVENIYSFYNQDKDLQPDFSTNKRYILFHGNLSVQENIETAEFIINKLAPNCNYDFVLAGKNPSDKLISMAEKFSNIRIMKNPSEEEMNVTISQAQINLLLTEQATGLKLKLLNALYQGKHCLVNNKMLVGTGLDSCVNIANGSKEILSKISELMSVEFTPEDYNYRAEHIPAEFNNETKAKNLARLLRIQ